MIKLIALDLDGTLLSSDKTISEANLKCLKKCEQMGIAYMLVTGRNRDIVTPIVQEYQLHCDLILNAGHEYLSQDERTHRFVPMKQKTMHHVCQILRAYDYHISVHTTDGKYIFEDPEVFYQKHIDIMKARQNRDVESMKNNPLMDRNSYLHNIHQVSHPQDIDVSVLKIDARNIDPQKAKESIPFLLKIPGISLTSSFAGFLEVCEKDGNKAIMLMDVAKEKGIQKDEIAVFGDSMNDLDMITYFPNSFAMANAKQEVKQAACWVTASNDEDGVAKGIEMLLARQM